MICKAGKTCKQENGHKLLNKKKRGSSYTMHDSDLVFNTLDLKENTNFLDLGCGCGDYIIEAAKRIGPAGKVYGLDKNSHSLNIMMQTAIEENLNNVQSIYTDLLEVIPLANASINTCLISTVLHTLSRTEIQGQLFNEIYRIMKVNATLAIIECKKEISCFGPPIHMRIGHEEISLIAQEHGFLEIGYTDLGCNYMINFIKSDTL